MDGTPPRRRGGPQGRGQDVPAQRNTPASAGRTFARKVMQRGTAEHPRVGGEDPDRWTTGRVLGGSPPRRRGGRERPGRPPAVRRNTPASAGGQRQRLGRRGLQRNTPASAGRTGRCTPTRGSGSEHPRVGGEDITRATSISSGIGTPPRRRGEHPRVQRRGRGDRNTPASAGRTTGHLATRSTAAEHPRVGGEDTPTGPIFTSPVGTPSRRRGGHKVESGDCIARRDTPASAGRTRMPRPP